MSRIECCGSHGNLWVGTDGVARSIRCKDCPLEKEPPTMTADVVSFAEKKRAVNRDAVKSLTAIGYAWAQTDIMGEIARLAALPENATASPALHALSLWMKDRVPGIPDADVEKILDADEKGG